MTNDPVIALGKVEKDFVTNVTSSFVFDFSSFLLGGLRHAEKSFTLSVSYLSHCSCNKSHFVLTCKRLYSCGRTYCNSDFPPFKTNAFGMFNFNTFSDMIALTSLFLFIHLVYGFYEILIYFVLGKCL